MIVFHRYHPATHHRRSIRLKGYDYSREGMYFITICTHGRECLFGKIENGIMMTNTSGRIVLGEWFKTTEIRSNIELGEFVIMPNHIHGIIIINAPPASVGAYGNTPYNADAMD